MIQMPVAFVLINSEPGKEREIVELLRRIPEVKEANPVYGVYDIVAKVEAPSLEALKEVVTSKIRNLKQIKSTLTMMAMESAL